MAAEYQEVLAIHSKDRSMPLDSAIALARENVRRSEMLPPPAGAPEPSDSVVFEKEVEEDFDVVARIVRLEHMIEGLKVGGGMGQLLEDLGSIDLMVGDESILSSKVVIPHGYPMPSDELSEMRQQYAEAVSQLERAQWMQNQLGQRWKEIAFIPERAIQLAVVLVPIVELMVEEAGLQANVDVLRVSIPRGLAVTAKAVLESTTAERVAMNEFVHWALDILDSEITDGNQVASKIKANLVATGMITG
jgi:hypothetical protein